MKEVEQRKAAKAFAEKWKGIGDEKQDTHTFWIELFQKVFGVKDATDQFKFEYRVKREAVNGKRDTTVTYIDALLPKTHVLVEQKSITVDLDSAYKQSDKQGLTPFGQAMQYNAWLPVDLRAKWIVVCNFDEFRIHDLNDPTAPPVILKLSELEDKYHALDFMIDSTVEKVTIEEEISFKAGQLVGRLYDELLKCYKDPSSKDSLHSLNVLCVRLVFCLYAEDAGIFGRRRMFHDYLAPYRDRPSKVRRAILELFDVFDTPIEERDQYLEEDLAAFPYVNGSLFANAKAVEIPNFTSEIVNLLLEDASEGFDWSKISPTIFGAVFESTLNPETRRKGGMHYTSIKNIHKVIDPLFMNDLNEEFSQICAIKSLNTKHEKLQVFHDKLASLTFLDPACGSGNFLTETYLSLRRLENNVIRLQSNGQAFLNVEGLSPVKISLSRFYGIEINDFACAVAKTALWIAESQMLNETKDILGLNLPFFPLKTLTSISEGNALDMDWNELVPSQDIDYVMGNPPFVGYKLQTEKQKEDLRRIYGSVKKIDYVAGWFLKGARYIKNTKAKVGFVSTNSITQGEQVSLVWKPILDEEQCKIDFAYRTFKWESEALDAAAVHCVIVGFSAKSTPSVRRLFIDSDNPTFVENINPYLVDNEDVFIEAHNTPLCQSEIMAYGSEPREGNYLVLDEDEKNKIQKEAPGMAKYIKRYVSADDFINNKVRYCIWIDEEGKGLKEASKSKTVLDRFEACRKFRESSKQKQAHASAGTPYFFTSRRQPTADYLLVPIVSSENRSYVPIGYMSKDVILSNAAFSIKNASDYTFGVLTSSVHMAWMRAVAGRLEMRYRYSNTLVYNTFVWPKVTPKQKEAIEESARKILEARRSVSDWTLADMYRDTTMPPELRAAHAKNDKAVLKAYGLKADASESEIVSHLMKLYVQKVAEVEKTEEIDNAVQKVIGKKAESVPDWMEDLRKQCFDGKITTDDLISQGKARLKEEKKKAKEAEKAASKASK